MSKKNKAKKLLENQLFVGVATAVILAVISFFANSFISIRIMDTQITNLESNMQNNFDTVQKNIENINNDFSSFQDNTNNSIANMERSIGNLEGKVSIIESNTFKDVTQIASTGTISDFIKTSYQNDETICNSNNKRIPLTYSKPVAENEAGNEQYTMPELENETITMFYEENGEEVFFKGQFDEKGYWDKNCVINRYKNGKLVMIMDAIYESGTLKSYQQVFPYTTLSNKDVWVFSNRVPSGSSEKTYMGETYMYIKNMEYEKNFPNNDASDMNIINVKEFRKLIPLNLEGYYNGYTSNGKFNDDSSDAYIVKYDENGNVRFLYVGKIKDGVPHDSSGDAWSISWGYANNGYYYYKGVFSNGDHGEVPKNWQPMTPTEITSIVNPNNFNCPLTGLIGTS